MTDTQVPLDLAARPWFFCGIGGSGMLPLAQILKAAGAEVAGSDRSRDQGRTPEKFAALEAQGFTLFPQDGSGISNPQQILVASAAIEDSVPEIARAAELGCLRLTRAQLLSALFNRAPTGVAVAGTSGKSTVTAMLGWIMSEAGLDPTIMNGAVMKNFVTSDNPLASARIGAGGVFISEVDESDGSIALYRPAVGVLLNVSLDHKSMAELRALFGDFLAASASAAINADDAEALALRDRATRVLTFGFAASAEIGVVEGSAAFGAGSSTATICDRRSGVEHPLHLPMPGRHNLSNALAALAGANLAGVPLADGVAALARFAGLARRFDVIGTSPAGVTVIDDFGHNPEKCAATLRTLKTSPGRVIALFQPHGYGPLRQMGAELAETFTRELGPDDIAIFTDPVYFGGSVDRREGSERIVALIAGAGRTALHIADRDEAGDFIAAHAKPGDRVVIMGARDDTLTQFARDLLARLP